MSEAEIALVVESARVMMDLAKIKDANAEVDQKTITTKEEAIQTVKEIEQKLVETEAIVRARTRTIFGWIDDADRASLQALQRSIGVVRQIYGLIKQALQAAGISMPPILSALISTAFTVATTLLSLAQANMSNPYTVALGIMALIGAGISLAAAIDAESKSQQIQAALSAAQSQQPAASSTGYEVTII